MSNILRFKKGAVRTYVIAQVKQLDTGVGCFDSKGEMLGFIHVTNPVQKDRVEELIIDYIDDTKKTKQPDWSFITEPELAGSDTAEKPDPKAAKSAPKAA